LLSVIPHDGGLPKIEDYRSLSLELQALTAQWSLIVVQLKAEVFPVPESALCGSRRRSGCLAQGFNFSPCGLPTSHRGLFEEILHRRSCDFQHAEPQALLEDPRRQHHLAQDHILLQVKQGEILGVVRPAEEYSPRASPDPANLRAVQKHQLVRLALTVVVHEE